MGDEWKHVREQQMVDDYADEIGKLPQETVDLNLFNIQILPEAIICRINFSILVGIQIYGFSIGEHLTGEPRCSSN